MTNAKKTAFKLLGLVSLVLVLFVVTQVYVRGKPVRQPAVSQQGV